MLAPGGAPHHPQRRSTPPCTVVLVGLKTILSPVRFDAHFTFPLFPFLGRTFRNAFGDVRVCAWLSMAATALVLDFGLVLAGRCCEILAFVALSLLCPRSAAVCDSAL